MIHGMKRIESMPGEILHQTDGVNNIPFPKLTNKMALAL